MIHRRPTWAEISLPALAHNYRTIKNHVGRQVQVMAVVKADAYGHGAVECARTLEDEGADWFGVALVEEGAGLREAGVTRPIFCLGGFWHGQAEDVVAHDLTPSIFRLDSAEELNATACEAGRVAGFHLKVDTGLGRLGIQMNEVAEFARALRQFSNLRFEGLWTHFADADAADPAYTDAQIAKYYEALRIVRAEGFDPVVQHLANSPGLHAHHRALGTMVRAGATLYGLKRDVLAPSPEPLDVRPVMSLHSRIILLKTVPAGASLGYGRTFTTGRESRIATIAIGYADGLRRAHSNNGRVIVRSQQGSGFAPIVGRVSMDLTLLDVTDVPGVATGDEVILIGEADGLRISAEDVAEQIGTISYEVVTSVSARVPRVYGRP
ncbi:MAG TPA: alanine racemase [Blastocatellia bacterium]|nr:alanine racemase [Blastocatellia bacterium]